MNKKQPEPVIIAPDSLAAKIPLIAGGIFAVGLLFWMALPEAPRPAQEVQAEQESINRHEAFGCAADELRTLLRSPSSLDIDNTTTSITKVKEREFSVSGGYDALNGFGAMIRSRFRCDVLLTTSDRCMSADCTIY